MIEQLPLTLVGVVVIVAVLFGILAKKFGQNPVLGFILAGLALGPLGLSFLQPGEGLAVTFGELGLFVLLFYLGLELSLKRFLSTGSTAMVLALVDMVLLALAGTGIILALGYSLLFAVVVGVMLLCTSTAVVAKFVIDNKLVENAAAQISLAMLILQDFLAILLLVFISSLSVPGSPFTVAGVALVFVVSAFTVVRQLSQRVEAWLQRAGYGHTETTLYALGLGLVVATIASFLGLSAGLGAYFAGFALAETRAGNRIKIDLAFLRDFFLLFFFVGFGASLFYNAVLHQLLLPSLSQFLTFLGIALVLTVVVVVGHALVFGVVGRRMGLSREDASLGAILLTPLGEFVVIISTFATPILIPAEAAIVAPLEFLLILVSVVSFQPLFDSRAHHQRLVGLLPLEAEVKKLETLPARSPHAVGHAKAFAVNAFVVLCLLALALYLYEHAPVFDVGIPYSRAALAFGVFALFAAYPFLQAARAVRRLFNENRRLLTLGKGRRGRRS